MSRYPIITVKVTRNFKFRATIQETRDEKYEVTVNGVRWKMGKGRKYEEVIILKIKNILLTLQRNYESVTNKSLS